MRFLHTSDWHLGRALHGVDLLEAQRSVLEQIVAIAVRERIDAVIVAGDIYDRAVPPVEAVSLFSATLAALAEHTTVIVTSGNHDSAIRLGYGSQLFRDRIKVHTDLDGIGNPVVLADAGGEVAVYPLPYLDPDSARLRLSAGDEPLPRSHQAVMTAALDRVRTDLAGRPGVRSVVVAHAFVVGGVATDSERSIVVGGVDSVAAETFEGIDYVALGHLHGAQSPRSGGTALLSYSGSPLRYSFAEATQAKSVTLVELTQDGGVQLSRLPLQQPRAMVELTGTLAELLAVAGHEHDWVKVVVTDRSRPEALFDRLKHRFPHLLHVEFSPAGLIPAGSTAPPVLATARPRELGADFIQQVSGLAASEAELELFEAAFNSATAGS
ncbi:MAG TPA: exonuclease SbcCD subunit D [Jatrophihabitans sp.]|nr:exonuclease SbcCD subunit D [Jatrophihabitans sp.]